MHVLTICCMHSLCITPKGGSEPNLARETELLVQKHLIELKIGLQ